MKGNRRMPIMIGDLNTPHLPKIKQRWAILREPDLLRVAIRSKLVLSPFKARFNVFLKRRLNKRVTTRNDMPVWLILWWICPELIKVSEKFFERALRLWATAGHRVVVWHNFILGFWLVGLRRETAILVTAFRGEFRRTLFLGAGPTKAFRPLVRVRAPAFVRFS